MDGQNSLPQNRIRVNNRDEVVPIPYDDALTFKYRRKVEPWLSALFQSEHLSLLIGSGLTTAIAARCGIAPFSMNPVSLSTAYADTVSEFAAQLANNANRGEPNLEDQIRASLQLIGGLEILKSPELQNWNQSLETILTGFVSSIIETEHGISQAIANGASDAAEDLISFLLSFSSRLASRDRLNIFTTNYDRLVEFGCDLIGLRTLDRFVGTLGPVFRSSRIDVDLHYNPPGIRGEPRYLEGVVRLAKLHGSIDWIYDNGFLRRRPIPFGTTTFVETQYASTLIYPNPAKDVETLEYPYADLFRDFSAALCRPNSVLATYGYGFGDDHINRVISDMLTIPSTHLLVLSYTDVGTRFDRFRRSLARDAQLSYLIGSDVADLHALVANFLPKPAIDAITIRRAELERRRELQQTATISALPDIEEGGKE